VLTRHNTTPDICVEDSKSAIRWVRVHAKELGVDPQRVVSFGSSAGGHLAAAVALCPKWDGAEGEDRSVSSKPNAMVLFNPAMNLTAKPVKNMAGESIERDLSPNLFVAKGTPPALLVYGTKDDLKPQGDEFAALTRKLGNRCDYYTATDQPHGFFNEQPWNTATAILADQFLTSLGYLKGAPTLTPTGATLDRH
jgi:acetyl esterase/lipase